MKSRKFHLGDILSVTTGRLVSPRHIEGIYDILNFMTGDSLFTHQLPRACESCGPVLIQQHPKLADIDASSVNSKNWERWLQDQVSKFGEELDITPLQFWIQKNPITELKEMIGNNKIIAVVTE